MESTKEEVIKLQKQLLQQQKLASIGQLTAGIMHEIQNPLNFVNNFSTLSINLIKELKEIIEEESEGLSDDAKDELAEVADMLESNINKILKNGQRAESIVKGMLLQSRGKAGVFQAVDVNEMIRENVNLAYHGKRAENKDFNASFDLNFDDSIGKIQLVPQDFSRVILNIVNNSCDAVFEKTLKTKDYEAEITVSTTKVNEDIHISIRDNGCGIPKEIKNKIFEAFFSTKEEGKGTGLGLAMSMEIIRDTHKGRIEVNSKENEFTEFIIIIPTNLKN